MGPLFWSFAVRKGDNRYPLVKIQQWVCGTWFIRS